MVHTSEFGFEDRKQEVVGRGEVGTVGGVGKHVLVEKVSQSQGRSMRAGIVMLQNEFPVCISIHSSYPHSRAFPSDALSQMMQGIDVGL